MVEVGLDELLLVGISALLRAIHHVQELVYIGIVESLALDHVGQHLDFVAQVLAVHMLEGDCVRRVFTLDFRNQKTAFLVLKVSRVYGMKDQLSGLLWFPSLNRKHRSLGLFALRQSKVVPGLASIPLFLQKVDQKKVFQQSLQLAVD